MTHTDALFANQSQSILDDLVALLGQSSPGIARTQNAVICDTRRPATWCLGKTRTRCNDAQARRTDPRSRQFGTFIQKEICQPLDLDSLWVGIPNAVEARVATLTNMPPIPPGAPGMAPGALSPPWRFRRRWGRPRRCLDGLTCGGPVCRVPAAS